MTRRRFYAAPGAFASHPGNLTLASDESRHLRDVLRLRPGDEVYAFDGEGREFLCTIDEISRDFAQLKVVADVEPARSESPLELTLAVALLKGEKFDLVVQKATELGVTHIVPVTTKLADVHLRDESDKSKRVARWQRIAIEAAKQSGRAFVPKVASPRAFQSVIQTTTQEEAQNRLMFSERDGQSLAELQKSFFQRPLSITAAVGSEGGWTDKEIAEAREAHWTIITLGGRTLRAETAAIAVTVLLQHAFGDLV
jgi:16S rRNA (uracil1498-N3)-methyltransferase